MVRTSYRGQEPQRRGAVAVFVAVGMIVLIAFVAIALDLSLLYTTKNELQRAADAAALAGASAYFTEAGLAQDYEELAPMVESRALDTAAHNPTLRKETLVDPADVVMGYWDADNPSGPIDPSGDPRYNAVTVTVRKTPGSPNGSVALIFANIFGIAEAGLTATATAVAEDRLGGYRLERSETSPFWPFTLHIDNFNKLMEEATDDYVYDDGYVGPGHDDINEITLYPWKWTSVTGQELTGSDAEDGSGNFGTLNIGVDNVGLAELESQIENGVAPEQLEAEVGTSELDFVDDNGQPITYEMTGNPGLSAGMTDGLRARIGDMVGFFIHDQSTYDGSNTTYRIVGVRYGRVMDVKMSGRPDYRSVTIQPAPYEGSNVIVEEYADPTDGQVGRTVLVK